MNKCSSRLCLDYLKIVASTADTTVKVQSTKEVSYTLSAAGDFIEIPVSLTVKFIYTTPGVGIYTIIKYINSSV